MAKIKVETAETAKEYDALKELVINQDTIEFSKGTEGIGLYIPNENGYSILLKPNGTWEIQ